MTTRTSAARPTRSRLLVPLLLGAALLAACGAGSDSTESAAEWDRPADSSPGGVTDEEAPATEAGQAVDEDAASDSAPAPPPAGGPAPEGRERAVIRTGTMHIRATDTAEAAASAIEVVEDAGGYVAGTDLSRDPDGVVRGSFTFRVPTAALTEVLDAFDELADTVLERRLDETDVTTQLVDLEAEVANLEAFEAELRDLLSEVRESGAEADDLLAVFGRINDVRAQIDQAEARRTMLTDQVAMSTVHLQLSPTASTGPVADVGWDPGGTARSALAATVRALTSLADTAIRLGLTVLPITLVLLAPVVLVAWLLRRWWRRRPRTTPATTPPPAAAWAAPAPPPAPDAAAPPETTPDEEPATSDGNEERPTG